MGVFEFKGAGDWLMDAANAIGETNDLYCSKETFNHSYQWRVKGHVQQKLDTIDLATVNILTENTKIRM